MSNMGKIDHGTSCISCHTTLPYALASWAAKSKLPNSQLSPTQIELLRSITTRIKLGQLGQPYLSGPLQSKGTESVTNALILATYRKSQFVAPKVLQLAFQVLWQRQIKTGANTGSWNWFSLGNEPWEAPDSQYWGAALAAIAVGRMPRAYKTSPNIQTGRYLLKSYLLQNLPSQSLHNQLTLLWASHYWKTLLNRVQKSAIISKTLAIQRKDGGWRSGDLISPSWHRYDGTQQHNGSDGYATGLVTYILKIAGDSRTKFACSKGTRWLEKNQNPITGAWVAYSLNKKRDLSSDVGKFMSDAATAFAVLALTHQH